MALRRADFERLRVFGDVSSGDDDSLRARLALGVCCVVGVGWETDLCFRIPGSP